MAELDLPGGRLHAAEWGGDGDGPAIVCVHGLGGSHLNWSLLGPRLAEHGRVWAVDLPGFGLSPLGDRRADLRGAVEVLGDALETVSPDRPSVLVGNSMGGLLSVMVAARRPGLVAGLALINPALPVTRVRGVAPLLVADLALLMIPGVGERWLRWRRAHASPERQVRLSMNLLVADAGVVDEELLAAHIALAARRRDMTHANDAFLQAARSLVRRMTLGAQVIWSDVAAVRAPTLLLQGARDRITEPSTGRRLAAALPDWRHRVHDDLGHLPMIEDPDRVAAEILDWLRTLEAAGSRSG